METSLSERTRRATSSAGDVALSWVNVPSSTARSLDSGSIPRATHTVHPGPGARVGRFFWQANRELRLPVLGEGPKG